MNLFDISYIHKDIDVDFLANEDLIKQNVILLIDSDSDDFNELSSTYSIIKVDLNNPWGYLNDLFQQLDQTVSHNKIISIISTLGFNCSFESGFSYSIANSCVGFFSLLFKRLISLKCSVEFFGIGNL
jgi:hypothetical protein